MASGGSRYSLVQGGGAFVSVSRDVPTTPPAGGAVQEEVDEKEIPEQQPQQPITCKLCLTEATDITKLAGCGCVFCTEVSKFILSDKIEYLLSSLTYIQL